MVDAGDGGRLTPSILSLCVVIPAPHLFLGKQAWKKNVEGGSPFSYWFSITAEFRMDGLGMGIGDIYFLGIPRRIQHVA